MGKKTEADAWAEIEARVLLDHGALRADQVVSGPRAYIEALAAEGVVDPNPDAVAYARQIAAQR